MLDQDIAARLRDLYAAEPRTVLSVSVTGGGSHIFPMLYTVPGASRCLLDSQIPYARSAMDRMLGTSIHQSVSRETAAAMAEASLERAGSLLLADTRKFESLQGVRVLGISCTAALRSLVDKKGTHRCHIACASSEGDLKTYSLVLENVAGREKKKTCFVHALYWI